MVCHSCPTLHLLWGSPLARTLWYSLRCWIAATAMCIRIFFLRRSSDGRWMRVCGSSWWQGWCKSWCEGWCLGFCHGWCHGWCVLLNGSLFHWIFYQGIEFPIGFPIGCMKTPLSQASFSKSLTRAGDPDRYPANRSAFYWCLGIFFLKEKRFFGLYI